MSLHPSRPASIPALVAAAGPSATPSCGTACGGCAAAALSRRQALQRLAGGAVGGAWGGGLMLGSGWAHAGDAADAADGPREGDVLVSVDADTPVALRVDALALNAKQIIAWPHDPASGRSRDGSRLNRILLLRLDGATLDDETRARAADGVLAYSAVCTHQGCDVSAWRAAEKTLLCFCHFSQFQPAQGASVVAGPAPRSLPWLPLRSEGGKLVLAGGFSAKPGGHVA